MDGVTTSMPSSASDPSAGRKPKASARRHVISELEQLVFTQFEPGTALPSESELAERYGVSRLTVREATKHLEARGLIEIHHGRRPVIARPNAGPIRDFFTAAVRRDPRGLLDLLEVRRALEVSMARAAAARASRTAITAMESALEAMKNSGDDGSAFHDADVRFHESLADATGNQTLTLLLEALEGPLRLSRIQSFEGHLMRGLGADEVISQHERILDRVREHDAAGAADAMRAHLLSTEQDLRARLVADQDQI